MLALKQTKTCQIKKVVGEILFKFKGREGGREKKKERRKGGREGGRAEVYFRHQKT
jgi:hypothetical protein